MNKRIVGLDIARAYAILGMFIVNFVNVFGGYQDRSAIGKLASLFNGNASCLFVILAGMGIVSMIGRTGYTGAEKNKARSVIWKRSWFLFVLGLLLYNWWPFDILHFYGGYLHIAGYILFMPKKWYLYGILLTVFVYHILLYLVPYETGWDFSNFTYTDFWSVKGFIRNSLYNGSNPIFPWFAFFLFGMWLGKSDWTQLYFRTRLLFYASFVFIITGLLQCAAARSMFSKELTDYVLADYFPPLIPFMLSTGSAGVIIICICMYLEQILRGTRLITLLANTGRMTLTHYIIHLTAGMLILSALLGKSYSPELTSQLPTPAFQTMLFAVLFYLVSILFTYWWTRKYKYGPLEILMRKISG